MSHRRRTILVLLSALVFCATVASQLRPSHAQAPSSTSGPATSAGNPPPEQLQRDREWLVAYLIAHNGYTLDHMTELEAKVNRMSPTQLETLVLFYKQKHDMALQRESAWMVERQQMLAQNEAARQRRQQALNRVNEDESAAARQFESSFQHQQEQARSMYDQNRHSLPAYQYNPWSSPAWFGYWY